MMTSYLYTWTIRASVEAAVITCTPSISKACVLHMLRLGGSGKIISGSVTGIPEAVTRKVKLKVSLPVEPR